MSLDEAEVAHWREWIGRTERRTEMLELESLRRYAAAIGESLDVEQVMPSLGHWAFFLPVVAGSNIGADGHPKRGGFLPPVTLPRRMFAAADMRFPSPLVPGLAAERISVIADVTHKSGRSGDLVLVGIEHRIEQQGRACIVERQTIIYRDAGGPTPPVESINVQPGPDEQLWQPGPVDLFRFSAVTFNSHRIHYDLPYATGEEGYPGLVVHGPFTAARLFGLARRRGEPSEFGFRALAPLFCGQPVILGPDQGEGDVRALRCDGATAMTASVKY